MDPDLGYLIDGSHNEEGVEDAGFSKAFLNFILVLSTLTHWGDFGKG